jgi:glycosyltransferase involved in cell wall biosynthesis
MPADKKSEGPVPGRVSVMIPAYNQEPFIEDTISSVLSQSYPDLEVV